MERQEGRIGERFASEVEELVARELAGNPKRETACAGFLLGAAHLIGAAAACEPTGSLEENMDYLLNRLKNILVRRN